MTATASAPSRAPRRANDLGPVGRQVARNIEALREDRRLTQKELADRMTALGRPMTAQVASKVEQCERRVDADDLVAFAEALGVTPARLLAPPETAAAEDHPAVLAARGLVGRVTDLVAAAGDPQAAARAGGQADRALRRVRIEIEELLASTGPGHHDTTERTTV